MDNVTCRGLGVFWEKLSSSNIRSHTHKVSLAWLPKFEMNNGNSQTSMDKRPQLNRKLQATKCWGLEKYSSPVKSIPVSYLISMVCSILSFLAWGAKAWRGLLGFSRKLCYLPWFSEVTSQFSHLLLPHSFLLWLSLGLIWSHHMFKLSVMFYLDINHRDFLKMFYINCNAIIHWYLGCLVLSC